MYKLGTSVVRLWPPYVVKSKLLICNVKSTITFPRHTFLIPSLNIYFSLWSPLWPLLPHRPTHRRLSHHQCPHRTPRRLLPPHRLYLLLTNQSVDLFHLRPRQDFMTTNRLRLIVPADSIQFILAICFIMGDTRSCEKSAMVRSLLSGLPKIPCTINPSPFTIHFMVFLPSKL